MKRKMYRFIDMRQGHRDYAGKDWISNPHITIEAVDYPAACRILDKYYGVRADRRGYHLANALFVERTDL